MLGIGADGVGVFGIVVALGVSVALGVFVIGGVAVRVWIFADEHDSNNNDRSRQRCKGFI